MALRLLGTLFEIDCNIPELAAPLAYLLAHAEQTLPPRRRVGIRIVRAGGGYALTADAGAAVPADSPAAVLAALHAMLHDAALAALPDHIRLHAATGAAKGAAFLLVGAKRAGKTTLAARLLLDGVAMAGDELALLLHGRAVAFPRRFYLRASSLALLPDLARAATAAPFVQSAQEPRLLALDPVALGRPWQIAPLPVAAIFAIVADHGGHGGLEHCGKAAMVRRLLAQCSPPPSQRPDWVADLATTVAAAATFVLHLGELDRAAIDVRRALRIT